MKHALALLSILFAVAFASAQGAAKVGAPAPVFSGPSIDGGFYDLEGMKGKVVLLTFWSTRCEICRSEIPKLNSLMQRYSGRNVEMLGVSTEGEDRINAYLKGNPFKFHIIPDGFGAVLQYADRTRSGGIEMGFPAYFLIDEQGRIAYRGSGWDRTDEIAGRLEKMLSAPSASVAP